ENSRTFKLTLPTPVKTASAPTTTGSPATHSDCIWLPISTIPSKSRRSFHGSLTCCPSLYPSRNERYLSRHREQTERPKGKDHERLFDITAGRAARQPAKRLRGPSHRARRTFARPRSEPVARSDLRHHTLPDRQLCRQRGGRGNRWIRGPTPRAARQHAELPDRGGIRKTWLDSGRGNRSQYRRGYELRQPSRRSGPHHPEPRSTESARGHGVSGRVLHRGGQHRRSRLGQRARRRYGDLCARETSLDRKRRRGGACSRCSRRPRVLPFGATKKAAQRQHHRRDHDYRPAAAPAHRIQSGAAADRKSTRLNSSH